MVTLEQQQADATCIQPVRQPRDVGGGTRAAPGAFHQVAGDDQAFDGRSRQQAVELFQGLGQRMGGNAISGQASGPLVTKVDVGDDGRFFAGMDGRAFGEAAILRRGGNPASRTEGKALCSSMLSRRKPRPFKGSGGAVPPHVDQMKRSWRTEMIPGTLAGETSPTLQH